MAKETLVQIQIRGADVTIIGGEVRAVQFPPPSATTWLAGDARICTHSAKAGEALPFASCQRRTFSRALSSKAGAARTFSATS